MLLSVSMIVSMAPATLRAQQTVTSSSRPLAPQYQVHANGSVSARVCFNWSCATQQTLTFTVSDMAAVAQQMALCPGQTLHERIQRTRIGIWQMELLAQKYQPLLGNDEAINVDDQDRDGRMDCIDNASNTTTWLHVLHDLGLLPGWLMAKPRVRDTFSFQVHWTAVAVDARSAQSWAVDSWFRPNGHLPFVLPLADWESGRLAWQPPFNVWNPYPRYTHHLCGA